MNNIKKIVKFLLLFVRDMMFVILPGFIVRRVFGTYDFVFVAAPPTIEDYTKKYEIFENKLICRLFKIITPYFWPMLGEKIWGFRSKYNVEIKGRAIFCPLTAGQLISEREIRVKKIYDAIKLADKLGAKITILGGFTSIATKDGISLLGTDIKTKLTTGNAYGAIINVKNLMEILSLAKKEIKELTIAIIGAAGSMGYGTTKYLAPLAKKMILIDIDLRSLKKLIEEIKSAGTCGEIIYGNDINLVRDADGIIVATSAPYEIVANEHLKRNAIVIDGARPNNVSKKAISERSDIIVVDSAIVKIAGLKTNFKYGYGSEEEVPACMGEGMNLCWMGHNEHFALGKVTVEQMNFIWSISEKSGIKIADFRNQLGPVSKERIKKALLKK